MEGDRTRDYSFAFDRISTHALTWRATRRCCARCRSSNLFLPTPSHGGRHKRLIADTDEVLFLPTPSHGGRRMVEWVTKYWLISTHALTWRATCPETALHRPILFLPTPSHGGRQADLERYKTDAISTHALTWRATRHACLEIPNRGNFYPRPHMEGD